MTKLLFIGQAPPKIPTGTPFGRTHLYRWFERVGISKEAVLGMSEFTALTRTFPGANKHGHKPPTLAEIEAERPRVLALIEKVSPHCVVPVGIMAIREILGNPVLSLAETIGNVYEFTTLPGRSIAVVPLPHPSGASPWVHMGDNGILLDRALKHLKELL
jgi:uracil-DNA glycosylase